MTTGTVTSDYEGPYPGIRTVRITCTGATTTYLCPHFAEIVAVVGNNETNAGGVGVGVSSQTITLTPVGTTDVITLIIAGRK